MKQTMEGTEVMRGLGRKRTCTGAWPVLAAVFAVAVASSVALSLAAAAGAAGLATWGVNQVGQLGIGTSAGPDQCDWRSCSATPVTVRGITNAKAIAAGTSFGLALLESEQVVAWGENGTGQLGDRNTRDSATPVPVSGLGPVTAIAAGSDFGLALLRNGTVEAWGDNRSGALGDGTTISSDAPVPVNGLSSVVAIAAGAGVSLALLKDGTVMAWGSNANQQLGDGKTPTEQEYSDVPVAVNALGGVSAIAAGATNDLAMLSDGTVMAWGKNGAGQLGDGTLTSSDTPVAVTGLTGVTAISAGANTDLALLANGTVMGWGSAAFGQLAREGSEVEACGCEKAPILLPGLSGVSAVAAGSALSLVVLGNGTVMAFGAGAEGRLGDGRYSWPTSFRQCGSCVDTPEPVCGLTGATDVANGPEFELALGAATEDCTREPAIMSFVPHEAEATTCVTILGDNLTGAVGVNFGGHPSPRFWQDADGSLTAEVPDALPEELRLRELAAIFVHTPEGDTREPEGQGALNQFFRYGQGGESCAPTVRKVSPDNGRTAATAGTEVTITGPGLVGATAVDFGGAPSPRFTVHAEQFEGSVTAVVPAGRGTVDVRVTTPAGTSSVEPSDRFTYAPRGAPYTGAAAWGGNSQGELGDASALNSEVPVAVAGLRGVVSVAAGSDFNLALLQDGTVMAWGSNYYGSLGNGTHESSGVPQPVPGLHNVVAIAAGEADAYALLNNGTVRAWGPNNVGQLGDGNTTDSSVPVSVSGLTHAKAIGAASALLRDGTEVDWGWNGSGSLGDGTTSKEQEYSDVPVPVTGLRGVTALSQGASGGPRFAVLAGGGVVGWGANDTGQLGDGSLESSDVPVPVSGLRGARGVASDTYDAAAVLGNGRVMSWGISGERLGDGWTIGPEPCGPFNECSKVPIPVVGITGAIAVSAGGNHAMALLGNGRVMTWGENSDGDLGDGTETDSRFAELVPELSGVAGVSAGTGSIVFFGQRG